MLKLKWRRQYDAAAGRRRLHDLKQSVSHA